MSSDVLEGVRTGIRLGIVTNDFPPRIGGIQTYLASFLGLLHPDEVVVVAPDIEGARAFDASCAFEVVRVSTPTKALVPTPRTAGLIASLLKSRGVDVVGLTSMMPLAPLGRWTSQLLDVPLIVWHHGAELAWLARVPGGRTLLRREGSRVCVHFVVSNWTGSIARSVFGKDSTIRLMRFGVDTQRFRPPKSSEEKVKDRKRLGLEVDRSDPLVLSVGRLIKRKGNDVLIAAMTMARSQYPASTLIIVGSGPDLPRLKKLASRTHTANAVRFLGPLHDDHLPSLYRSADIFAAPIRSRFFGLEGEGLGITLLEAASSGLPVVAGRSGGTPEALIDRVTGFIVDGTDPYDIAFALGRLAGDKDLRLEMGLRGRAYVQSEFSREQMVRVYRSSIQEVNAGGSR